MDLFTRAIVRRPCERITEGISTAGLGVPDYRRALAQHRAYVEALQQCGLQVEELPADDRFPDSTFVEDTALCTADWAVITNPGAPSRNGEQVEMRQALEKHFPHPGQIRPPGTLDAGDVMMTGDHFFIGLSRRTNAEGAAQLIDFLQQHGKSGSTVALREMLHLKTGVAYLEQKNMLACGELAGHPAFGGFHLQVVPAEEAYAANSLWVNGTVLVPAGFPKTRSLIRALGYPVIELDMSEFQKVDGGLSCLSLRF